MSWSRRLLGMEAGRLQRGENRNVGGYTGCASTENEIVRGKRGEGGRPCAER